MLKVAGSTSTKTGLAPIEATAPAVAAKVKAGTKTASPGFTPIAISAIISASRPLDTPIACRRRQRRRGASRACSTSGPRMNCPWASTASIRALRSDSSRARCRCRSKRPIRSSLATASTGERRRHRAGTPSVRTGAARGPSAIAVRIISASFSASSPAWPSTSGGAPDGDAVEERVDLGREVVARRERDALGGDAALRAGDDRQFRRGEIGDAAAGRLRSRRCSAPRRPRPGSSRASRRCRWRTRPAPRRRRSSRVATDDAARRDRDDRRRGQRQHQVDVVDHQVEDDVDIDRPPRPRRPPHALDQLRRDDPLAERTEGRRVALDMPDLEPRPLPRRARHEIGRRRNVGRDRLLDEDVDAGLDQFRRRRAWLRRGRAP